MLQLIFTILIYIILNNWKHCEFSIEKNIRELYKYFNYILCMSFNGIIDDPQFSNYICDTLNKLWIFL